MSIKLFQQAKKFLPIIGIIIFIYLIYTLDVNKIITALLSIHPLIIIISLFLTFPRIVIRNYAWQLIQKEHNIELTFLQSLKIFLIGYFYGSVTPAFMGQLMRVPYMKEKTSEPYGKIFVNTLMEVILHSLSLYGMIIIGAILIIGTFPNLIVITLIWIIILTIILFYFIKKERGEKLFYTLIFYFVPKKFKKILNRFVSSFYTDFPKIRSLIIPVILGIFTWIIIFSQEYIFVYTLGLQIPYLYFLILFPVANAAGFIPLTFAGLGIREWTSITLFSTLFGVEQEKVFVFTLLGFIVTDLFTGFIGFLLSLTETRKKKINLNHLLKDT